MPYGGRLKLCREQRGFTQDELARLAGMTATAISKMESGARNVTLDEGIKLAKALKISIYELAGVECDDSDRQSMRVKAEALKQHLARLQSEVEACEAVLAAV